MKFSWLLNIVLAVLLAVVSYLGFFRGNIGTPSAEDPRTPVVLNESERHHVLQDMRNALLALQLVMQGVSNKDMKAVEVGSKPYARTAEEEVASMNKLSPTLLGKLPFGMKSKAFKLHAQFLDIYKTAQTESNTDVIIPKVAALLQNCVACHGAYRVVVESEQK